MKRILRYLFDITILKVVYYIYGKLLNEIESFIYSDGYSHYDNVFNHLLRRIHIQSTYYQCNVHTVLFGRAVQESADFVEKHLKDVLVFKSVHGIWDYTIIKINEQKIDGACLELGVFKGRSINYFAERLPEMKFFGFDSFEGLAEDWKGHYIWKGKGHFDLKDGKLPSVRSNVTLVKGWFKQTLPEFCKNNLGKDSIRFINIDCDTYESSLFALEQFIPHFKPGSLLLFDEFIGFPNWQNGECRAWHEISKKHNIKFRYLGFAQYQALVEIIK